MRAVPLLWLALVCAAGAPSAMAGRSEPAVHSHARAAAQAMPPLEMLYANFIDASGALMVIDSGWRPRFDGADRAVWKARYDRSLAAVSAALAQVSEHTLSRSDRRALAAIRSGIDSRASGSAKPAGDCAAARRTAATGRELRTALYACFSSVGDHTRFEAISYSRVAALQLLEQIDEPARRRAVFMAMQPLWQAVNGDDSSASPYRRMMRAEAGHARANISSAEQSLALEPGAAERWLRQALEAWSAGLRPERIEPWDYRYAYSRAGRAVEHCTPREALQKINARFYSDLGADLKRLDIIEDLDTRPGMAPVDFTDYARIGRSIGGVWTPAIPYVSIILQKGGLSAANELAHEDGHAVHFASIRARPSLALPDDISLLAESVADIAAWSVFNPAWQRKYLGCAGNAADGLGARLGYIVQDMAWGLFEIRMAQEPTRDPNATWSEIADRYLHIAPHPEWSWWAVRGQLVDDPGYMLNYALGAFVTAELRARIAAQIGEFDTGNPRWYSFVSAHLLRFGGELPPRALLEQFLQRPVSNAALLTELRAPH